MIINTGMRTDIPAFYSRWLLNRLHEGYVMVRNPYYPDQVTRYSLSSDVVDLIGFCTKDPGPMLAHMDELGEFGQYWFVTVTPYGREIEPNVPDKDVVIKYFRELSKNVGTDSVGWRYDPILLNDAYTPGRHLHDFEHIASGLAGYTKTCVISFIDIYQKVMKNFPEAKSVPHDERIRLGREMIRIAGKYGMTVRPCAEGNELEAYGADCSGCMTMRTYETALHCRLIAPERRGARKECACYLACDIGAYNTCPHLCRYCYANYSEEMVRRNLSMHDPDSPFLTGGSLPGDKIHDAKQESWKDRQMSLFDIWRNMEP